MVLSLIQYFGSDRPTLRYVLSRIPPHKTYVEPFGGGALVLLNKPPSKFEIYNDLDRLLCNLFISVRDCPAEVQYWLSRLAYCEGLWRRLKEEYLEKRVIVHPPDPKVAAEYLALIIMSQDSSTAKSHGFKWRRDRCVPKWLFNRAFAEVSHRLQNVLIFNRDAIDVIRYFDSPDTFYYLDPPHPGASPGYRLWNAERVVSRLLRLLPKLVGKWLLRLSDTAEARALLRGFPYEPEVVEYTGSAGSGSKRKRYIFVSNY